MTSLAEDMSAIAKNARTQITNYVISYVLDRIKEVAKNGQFHYDYELREDIEPIYIEEFKAKLREHKFSIYEYDNKIVIRWPKK